MVHDETRFITSKENDMLIVDMKCVSSSKINSSNIFIRASEGEKNGKYKRYC